MKPEMKCVWVQAWNGAERMGLKAEEGHKILDVQRPVDNRLKGKSSWLRVVRIAKGLEDEAGNKPKPPAAKPGATNDLAAVSTSVQQKKEGQAA